MEPVTRHERHRLLRRRSADDSPPKNGKIVDVEDV